MTKLKQYRTRINEEGDIVCEFHFFASEKGVWSTEIEFNPLSEEICGARCDCPAQKFQSIKIEEYKCKHIKIAKKLVNKDKEELLK